MWDRDITERDGVTYLLLFVIYVTRLYTVSCWMVNRCEDMKVSEICASSRLHGVTYEYIYITCREEVKCQVLISCTYNDMVEMHLCYS